MSIPVAAFSAGLAIFFIVVWDAFEAIILPRRVTRKFRLTRLFYRSTWKSWTAIVRLAPSPKSRQTLLGIFGPISLLLLVAVWAFGFIVAFALMQYADGTSANTATGHPTFLTDLYLSGTTFFTLGLGDVLPHSRLSRILVVAEGGFGFGFLAIIIGYLPFIYGSFSQREVNISLLDSRAGTPPTAGELLRRHSYPHGQEALRELLKDWEYWAAELMESHLSYPVLAFFRSQHDNQSWIAALTAILDACSLVMVGVEGACQKQAELTFAMARHAVADLAQVFGRGPMAPEKPRLSPQQLQNIRAALAQDGLKLHDGPDADRHLQELRKMYEPFIFSLATYLHQSLPPWMPDTKRKDNWQTTAWTQRSSGAEIHPSPHMDDHS